ncbi:hypothetical protein DFQ28_002373 [Apophysomyces sp. BC1034]|nr:hypothetical protein DFQ28_002373 [Apophysomyces sp. BC1034]
MSANNIVAIKSNTFERVELSGKDAARFVRHMHEDKPTPTAQAALVCGRAVLSEIFGKTPIRAAK